ncbi:hypothetical protein Moror_12743 [Moniliophthora roreri MCA 2997]|uniref:Uncharacterized protein n=2 Tax=Moniliophthora roreri TaxID=221103 RepID=V2X8F9_MONRO|nr:hypothetical protein Moror_12743 [Moniliophthora roreri MCA 2997]
MPKDVEYWRKERTARRLPKPAYSRPEMDVCGFGEDPYYPQIDDTDLDLVRLALQQEQRIPVLVMENHPIRRRWNTLPVFVAAVLMIVIILHYFLSPDSVRTNNQDL